MPVFYYHRQNKIPKQLAEMTGQKGFLYSNRGELDFILQRQLIELGHDIDSRFHTIIGSIANLISSYIDLNPDDQLDRHTLKLLEQKNPWNYIKVLNGPTLMCVMGYVSAGGNSPFAMSTTQMAQKGILGVSYVPRPV